MTDSAGIDGLGGVAPDPQRSASLLVAHGAYTARMRLIPPKLHLLLGAFLLACAPMASAQMAFSQCIESLQRELPRHPKVRQSSFDAFTRDAEDLRPPIDSASRSQPEFEIPIWDYLARLVDEKRISDGRAILEQQAAALARITKRHGIDAATMVAVLGVESDYGRLQGRHKVVDATLSRSCLRLSSKDRKAQFFSALWLLQEGHVQADNFRGSWAGAFGMTQFMPATHTHYMADGDGDGLVDTVTSMPDALATTANYLDGLGWDQGLPWGIEVTAPPDLARKMASSQREHGCATKARAGGRCRSIAQWAELGVKLADGRALLADKSDWASLGPSTTAALLAPAGPGGPAWLVTRNFHAIWQYNRADAYALAIGLLSSALRGEPAIRTPWPSPEAALALSRAGVSELQTLLRAGGRCDLAVDGADGPMTREAIREEENRRGLPQTGRATRTLLELMRSSPVDPALKCPVEAGVNRS